MVQILSTKEMSAFERAQFAVQVAEKTFGAMEKKVPQLTDEQFDRYNIYKQNMEEYRAKTASLEGQDVQEHNKMLDEMRVNSYEMAQLGALGDVEQGNEDLTMAINEVSLTLGKGDEDHTIYDSREIAMMYADKIGGQEGAEFAKKFDKVTLGSELDVDYQQLGQQVSEPEFEYEL